MMIRSDNDDCMVATRAAHDYLTLGIRSVEIERDGVIALDAAAPTVIGAEGFGAHESPQHHGAVRDAAEASAGDRPRPRPAARRDFLRRVAFRVRAIG
jgi:hypothetical protein